MKESLLYPCYRKYPTIDRMYYSVSSLILVMGKSAELQVVTRDED